MKSLVKGIIIAAITIGIVVPAGYYSFSVYHHETISLTQMVPENSSMVIRADYNGTPVYAYNYSNTDGIVLGISMAGFSTELASVSNTSGSTGNLTIEPVLYSSYRGYDIYQIKNISVAGVIPQNITDLALSYNYSTGLTNYLQNETIYVVEVPSVVSIGSVQAVKNSIDALLDNANFQTSSLNYFNSTSNVSAYFKSTTLPVVQGIANVYSLHSDFRLQMSNATNARDLFNGLSGINLLNTNITVSTQISGNWVNGTMNVGIDNYYLLEELVTTLSKLNYTQYLSGYGL